jgi:two-component system, cell cycle sensor histidine kinase and response regulator CckA
MLDALSGTLETILVVDDNEEVLDTVTEILGHAHFRVLSADSGADAVELAVQTKVRIDLLLSEVSMPHMSGPDLGEMLKKARPRRHVMLMSPGEDGPCLCSTTSGRSFRSHFLLQSWSK